MLVVCPPILFGARFALASAHSRKRNWLRRSESKEWVDLDLQIVIPSGRG